MEHKNNGGKYNVFNLKTLIFSLTQCHRSIMSLMRLSLCLDGGRIIIQWNTRYGWNKFKYFETLYGIIITLRVSWIWGMRY
jgi:hypothetical protein